MSRADAVWLERLPSVVRDLERRWSLTVHEPFGETSAARVAPVTRADGSSAILKLGMPHMEAAHELHGLRFWDGVPTVRLLRADETLNAMLLERCVPGTPLAEEPEPEQDQVIAELLPLVWRLPDDPHPFRPLSRMLTHWSDEARERFACARDGRDGELAEVDPGLLEAGLELYGSLPNDAPEDMLLATDLHAGNVLRAERRPWLVIDPKPFIGDPAYDATQHLLNCEARLRADPERTISGFADLLGLDPERIHLWTFARAAAGPWPVGEWRRWTGLARTLAPS